MAKYDAAVRMRKICRAALAGLLSVTLLCAAEAAESHASELSDTAAVSGSVTAGDFEVTAKSGTVRIPATPETAERSLFRRASKSREKP